MEEVEQLRIALFAAMHDDRVTVREKMLMVVNSNGAWSRALAIDWKLAGEVAELVLKK